MLVIPVRLGRDPYGFIGRYQGLPGEDDPAAMARSIFELLASHEFTAPAMGSSIVHMVETAPSCAAAKARVERANAYAHWTPELLGRLEAAIDANSQVGQSFGVPAAIRAIVAANMDSGQVGAAPAPSAAAETASRDEWWLEARAPSLRLGLASKRGDPPWEFAATIHQEAGDSLAVIRAGWVGPSVPDERRPSEVEPRRAGEWRLPGLQFDPLDRVAGEPLSIEAEFVFGGQSRTQRWHWDKATDFQNVEATIERA